MSVTINDLRDRVNYLNSLYGKTNKTSVKLAIEQAYGGSQVVIKNNRGGGVRSVTYGYQSSRDTLRDLFRYESGLKRDLKYAHESEMKDRRRLQAIKSSYTRKKVGK